MGRKILDVENLFSVISWKVPCRLFEWRIKKKTFEEKHESALTLMLPNLWGRESNI